MKTTQTGRNQKRK